MTTTNTELIPQKFRKKPVVIEAMLWDGTPNATFQIRTWAQESGASIHCPGDETLLIETLEGTMTARPGDWIIRGVAGEFYPCKPDIFEQTYEEAS